MTLTMTTVLAINHSRYAYRVNLCRNTRVRVQKILGKTEDNTVYIRRWRHGTALSLKVRKQGRKGESGLCSRVHTNKTTLNCIWIELLLPIAFQPYFSTHTHTNAYAIKLILSLPKRLISPLLCTLFKYECHGFGENTKQTNWANEHKTQTYL